ncbi:MAG: P1 family peptidase [Candidatus Dadabacteria bacterium]|nr:P1 family peptidase [Candidatus Dadabacteria bacterium]
MGSITDVPGIRVGHTENLEAVTGCTVILFDRAAHGAVDLRGGGTSTRQLDPLFGYHAFGKINGIFLTGGSAYGLNASEGVMQFLEEKNVGLDVGRGLVVPSVPTAVIFDLGIGDGKVRPDARMGHKACLHASGEAVAEGCVGVGAGATIGKLRGIERATKGGLGTGSHELSEGVWIGVLVVVNAFGDVMERMNGDIIAGVRSSPEGKDFAGTAELIKQGVEYRMEPFESTTLAVAATNASFTKPELVRMARLGQTGITRVVSPSHTVSDGDVVFAISTGVEKADANVMGILAGELISEAIVRAVKSATTLGGIPCYRDLTGG